tara:strand:- start:678 stop:842 length:165 start_codon:yes stop_codon:yes gene_type:complete
MKENSKDTCIVPCLLQPVEVPEVIDEQKLDSWAELFLFYWEHKENNLHIEVAQA